MRSTVLLVAFSTMSVLACGGKDTVGPGTGNGTPTVASVAVTPGNATLVSLGETVQLTASARDASGNAISGKTFTWASSDQAIATVSGTGLVTAVANGAVTITATSDGVNGTAAVDVNQVAAQFTFTVQPTDVVAGEAITPAIEVVIHDANGNVVDNATVTVAIGTNPSGGTLSGTATVNAVGGVASFGDLSIDKAGSGYMLSASVGVLAGATSAAFGVAPAAAAQLAFTVQPTGTRNNQPITPAVTVAIQDQFGNTVTTATDAVTLAIGTNPSGGTLSGTATVNAVAGVASFTDLTIDQVGTGYTLMVSSGSLSTATSAAFPITRILFDNGSSSGPQTNFANIAGGQELFEDFTLSQNSLITTIRWQQHDHNTATYLHTQVVLFAGLPFDGPPVLDTIIIANRMANATGTLFDAWDGFDYEISGLSINLPPGTYWLGLNAKFEGTRSGWDNTTGGPNTIPDFRLVNMNFPAPGSIISGNLAFTLVGSPVTNPPSTWEHIPLVWPSHHSRSGIW